MCIFYTQQVSWMLFKVFVNLGDPCKQSYVSRYKKKYLKYKDRGVPLDFEQTYQIFYFY